MQLVASLDVALQYVGTCPGSSQRKLGKTQASSAGKEGGGKK